MTKLPDNWVSGYDGQRWYFQYEPTGMVQYHFPQEGDEYAEFLLDVGTGPIKLTPEDSLAIEQETKRRSLPGFEDDAKSGPKTSGSKREKKTIAGIEEYGMSATGYFDSSAYFPDAYNTISPLGDDDLEDNTPSKVSGISPGANPSVSNVAAELPSSSQQMWSPVGFVAELATQDTVKCAEELAPVELDATYSTLAPIRTNIAQQPAELPTHRTPVENKTLVMKPTQPTQPVMQPVDSYPLVHASFAYPPLKSDMNSANSASHDAISIGKQPADAGQNKFQPWKPTQDVVQQSQEQNKTPGTLPQTSVLQNQDSELGSFGKTNPQNPESSILGDVPNALAPPLEPGKSPSVETSLTVNPEASVIPAVLQPAQRPGEELSSPGTANQQLLGNQVRHDSTSVPVASHPIPYTPSVLKPGAGQPNNSLQESEGNHTQGNILPHRPSEQVIQASSIPNDHPNVARVNTSPDHLLSTNPKMNGSPGFLFFHEIPSKADHLNHDSSKPALTSQMSDPGRMDLQSRISVDEQIPAVVPLNFVKRNSSKSSQVSSIIPETPSSKPALASSDEISDEISVISNFTPQGTPTASSQPSQQPTHPVLGDDSKPSPTSMSEGVGAPTYVAASGRPQLLNQQQPNTTFPLHGQVASATDNVSKPISVAATPVTQVNMTMSPSNAGIATTQSRPNIQVAHHPSSSIQGSLSQNHHHSMALPSPAPSPGKLPMSPGPSKYQGNASTPFPPQTSAAIALGRPPSQISNTTHANAVQLGAQSSSINHTNNAVQQTQANVPASHVNTQIPATAPVQQAPHYPLGGNNVRPHSLVGPSKFEHSQSATQKPQSQHPGMVRPSSQQSAIQPHAAHQSVGPNISSQPSYQHSSPVTQSVSPIQSQVSSPAQSIASLHVSQTSTPAGTFATMNNYTGPNVNSNQTNIAPIRPSSVPAHTLSQQAVNVAPPVGFHSKPSSPAGIIQGQSYQTPSQKPYPMLPGQVTPLPSQIGSAPSPPPVQQPISNNYAKPTTNTLQNAVGQQPMQTTSGGIQVVPGQMNSILNPPQGNVVYGQASSQAQMKPPQQQAHSGATNVGGYQSSANQIQPQHMVSYPSPIVNGQPGNYHTTLSPSAGNLPANGQYAFSPPPVAQAQQFSQSPAAASPVTATQGKPFTSTQAAAALTDAGKGMKKWAKKVWKNPAIKQTAVGIGGAVMAESIGVNGAAGAQLANSLFVNATRPPLVHAQTAPPQAHGIPNGVPQQPLVQQHQPGKPQPIHSQPNHQSGHPQPGHPQPGHPQPGQPHPSQLQSGQLQLSYAQSSHSQLPGHPQPARPQPGHSQPVHQQPGHPQLAHSQPVHQPVGAQMPGRPPVAQNPQVAAGVAINFNAQAQAPAQVGFNQQQQFPIRPAMINIPPPPPLPPAVINVGGPSAQAQAQVNVDAANLATAAVIVGSAVGAAFHNNPQPQHGHAQSDHMSYSEPHSSGNHGYGVEHHEQAYGYADNSHMAADTNYNVDNSSYSANNTYIDNTEVVNNTIYIENSTAVVADATYNNTGYADTATYSGTEVTTDITVDVDVSSAVYTDSSATAFSMDESINVASGSDFAVSSTDYSGDGYGGFEF